MLRKNIEEFLNEKVLAVAGVSRNKTKFGNFVYRELKKKGYRVYPVNPFISEFEGDKCFPTVRDIPEKPGGVVVAVGKENSITSVIDSYEAGVRRIWLQNGSESEKALDFCSKNNISVIYKECILMFAQPNGFHKFHRWVNGLFGKLPA